MTDHSRRARLHADALTVCAVASGIAVPLLFAGRAAIAVALGFAVGGAALAWLAAPTKSRPSLIVTFWDPRRDPAAFAMAVMLGVWAVSAIATIDPVRSPLTWMQTAALILFAVWLPRILAIGTEARTLAYKALVLTALVGALLALFSIYLWPDPLGVLREGRPIDGSKARELLKAYGSVVACLAPVILWAGGRLGGWWRTAAFVFVPLAVLVILAVSSHAGLLGLGCAALGSGLLWVLVRSPRRVAGALTTILIVIGVVGTITVANRMPAPPYQGPSQLSLPTWLVDEHRQVIWGFAVDRGLKGPAFGYGLKTGGRVPGAKVFVPRSSMQYMPSHPHNWVFQIFLEAGFFGIVSALVALVLFLRKLAQAAAQGQGGAWAAFIVAAAFFGSTLANFSIWQAWWQAAYCILTALALAAVRFERESAESDQVGAEPTRT